MVFIIHFQMVMLQLKVFATYLIIIISSEMADPYQSVRSKINLPHAHNVKNDFKLFPPLNKQSQDDLHQLSEPLFAKTNDLVNELNESFQVYDKPDHHVFKFPPSLFPDVPPGQRNMITYEQKMIVEQENTFKNRLAEDQIEEIAEKGEFKVKSNIQYVTIPYVWKINETLFWGGQKIDLVWKNSLAKIYGMFVEVKDKLFSYVPSELQKIAKIPKLIFSIIFGKRSLSVVMSVDYQHEIFKDFWKKIMNENYKESEEWASALWKYMYVQYDPQLNRDPEHTNDERQMEKRREKKRIERQEQNGRKLLSDHKQDIIRAVDIKFNQQWGKLRKKVIVQVSEEINGLNNSLEHKAGSQQDLLVNAQGNNDEKILDVLAEKKFSLYIEHMKRQLPKENIPLNVVNAIVIILRLFKVINSKYEQKTKTIQKKKKEIEDKIRRNHPIKSLYPPFFTRHVDAEVSAISTALNEQMYQSLLRDKEFSSLLNEQQKNAYKQYIKLRSNYSILESAKKNQLRQLHEPSRIFYSNHMLLPPYNIIHKDGYYSLKKVSDDIRVDTNTNFWKFKLYWMRLKTWSINCLIFLVYIVWKGPTGLRCLFGKDDFGYEMEINYQTGVIYYNERRTVIGQFLKVLEGMNESRHRFQAQPDLGLLGKNVSRIFNYAECYLFRFLFVGVFLVLIGYPILIVFCSVVSTILVVTVWAWIPLILLVTYTFNIFIYQFESSLIPDRKIVRSIPIIKIIIQIVKVIIVTVLLTLNLILLVPLISMFIFMFCLIQRVFRATVDKLFVLLFRKVGRTPSRDTSIARKISGPGMSKEFYMSINEEDVYVIIQARLEQIFMTKFNELMHQEIQKNLIKSNQIIRLVLKPFNASNSGLNYINENTYKLNQNYSVQYSHYMARYPNSPNRVRFTQEEIDAYFDNTVNIVKNFVVRHEIEKWIFEQYVLYEDMYDELTRAIWIQVFGCGEEIFEPLQKLDARFKLEDQYNNEDGFNYSMKKNVRQVMKSLEGQVALNHHRQKVALNHHRQKVAPFKHNLLHRQQRTYEINAVFEYLNINSYLSINLDLQKLQSLFVPNLNINDIVTIQSERREKQISSYPNIVDL